MLHINPFDYLALATTSTVAAVDNTTLATPGISFEGFSWLLFIVNTTDASADTTVDFKIQQDDNLAMSSPTDITSLAITQFTAAATAQSAMIAVHHMDAPQGFVRGLMTGGDGTVGSTTDIIVIGVLKSYGPGALYDSALLQEKVSLAIS